MSFVQNLLRSREKHHLEETLQKAPEPAAFRRLARLYQEDGDLTRARQTAKRGAVLFPADAELARFEQDLFAQERDAETKRLREQIANYPNARLYARLAELYRAGRDTEKGFQVVRSGLQSFPDHGGLHYVLGLLYADTGAREEAVTSLSGAAELDKFNYAALKALAGLLVDLGRRDQAAATYAKILDFAPDDEEIQELHRQATGAAPAAPARQARMAAFAAGEEAPAAPAAPAAKPQAQSALAVDLSRIVGKDGIQGAMLVDVHGLVVAAALPAGQDEAAAAAVVAELRRTASPACGELGLGSFEEAALESADGSLYLYTLRELTLAVFAARRARAGLVALHARNFAKKCQGATAEEPA
jgi:predicted regulator of Ras-like GTPase activity (Roadblock/LC7/MglB family)